MKKDHLVEIKSLGSPPLAVKHTLAGLVILCEKIIISKGGELIIDKQTKEVNYFDTAKKYLLNDPKELLEVLMNFDKHSVDSS